MKFYLKKIVSFILLIFILSFNIQLVFADAIPNYIKDNQYPKIESNILWSKQVSFENIKEISLSSDGEYIAVNSKNGDLIILDKSGDIIFNQNLNPKKIAMNNQYFTFSYNEVYDNPSPGKDIIYYGHVVLYSISGEKRWDKRITYGDALVDTKVNHLSISDQKSLIMAATDEYIYIFDYFTEIKKIPVENIKFVSMSPDGNHIYSISGKNINIFDLNSNIIKTLSVDYEIDDISVSNDGYFALISNDDIYLYCYEYMVFKKSIGTNIIPIQVSVSGKGNWTIVSTALNGVYILDRDGEIATIDDYGFFQSISNNGDIVLLSPQISKTCSLLDISSYTSASLSIITLDGADVYLDGELKGKTPLLLKNIPYGNHLLTITKSGYETFENNIELPYGKTTEIAVPLSLIESVPTPIETVIISTPKPTQDSTSPFIEIMTYLSGHSFIIGCVAVFILISSVILNRTIKSSSNFEIKRGYVVLNNNNLKFGVKLINNTRNILADLDVILDYSKSSFNIESSEIVHIGNVQPESARTAEFVLKPLGCIHNDLINANIRYKNPKGQIIIVPIKPKEVHCVCPFLKEKIITQADFHKLTEIGESVQEGLSFKNTNTEDIYNFINETCVNQLYLVKELSIDNKKIALFAGESLGDKAYYLLTIIIEKEKNISKVILQAHSNNKYGLPGFMNEIIESIRGVSKIISTAKEIGIVENVQVINIIDSIVQRTNFDMNNEGKSNSNVTDSIVQKSTINIINKNCPNCKVKIDQSDKYCRNCGEKIK